MIITMTLDNPNTAFGILDYLQGRRSQKEKLLKSNVEDLDIHIENTADELAEKGLLELREDGRRSTEYVLTDDGKDAIDNAENPDDINTYLNGSNQVGETAAVASGRNELEVASNGKEPGESNGQKDLESGYEDGLESEEMLEPNSQAADGDLQYVLTALGDGAEVDENFEDTVKAIEGLAGLGDKTNYSPTELVSEVYDEDSVERDILSAYARQIEE